MDEMAWRRETNMRSVGELAKQVVDQAVAASSSFPRGRCITCCAPVSPLLIDGWVVEAYICADCERLGRE